MAEENTTKTKPTFAERIDTAIATIAPSWAKKRSLARLEKTRADFVREHAFGDYKGAEQSRLTKSWQPLNSSADAGLYNDLEYLRRRSRDLIRNNPIAAGILRNLGNNIIGTGIRPQSRLFVDGMPDEQTESLRHQIEDIWNDWADNYADSTGRLSFYGMQTLVDRSTYENGDVIVLPMMINDPARPYSLALQVVEADRLTNPQGILGNTNLRMGIEVDAYGKPTKYWIRKRHPGDIYYNGTSDLFEWDDIPATINGRTNVIHIYEQLRAGMSRGIPLLTPAMHVFHLLDRYDEAELVAAFAASSFAAFIKSDVPDPVLLSKMQADGFDPYNQAYLQTIETGTIGYLRPGESIEQVNATHPNPNFDAFFMRHLRMIAAAIGMPYELISGDLSQTSFSSGRIGITEVRRAFEKRQTLLTEKLCQPVFELLIEEAWLRGRIDLGNITADEFQRRKREFCKVKWVGQQFEFVDPIKDAQAMLMKLQMGITTYSEVCASFNRDYTDVFRQRAVEQQLMSDLGLSFTGFPAASTPIQAKQIAGQAPATEQGTINNEE